MRKISKLPNGKFAQWSTVVDAYFDAQLSFVEMVNELSIRERFTDEQIQYLMNPENMEPFEDNAAWMWFMNGNKDSEMYIWLATCGCDTETIQRIEKHKEAIKQESVS